MRFWLMIAVGLCLMLAACASEQSGQRDRADRPSRSSASAIDPGPSPAELAAIREQRQLEREQRVRRAVRSYYEAIDYRDLRAAWSRLDEGVRASFGGFASWSSGYEHTLRTDLTGLTLDHVSADAATVDVELRTVDLDPCADRVVQRFAGTWSLERVADSWIAVDVAIDRIAGAEPASTWRECDEAKHPEDYRELTYTAPPPVDPPPVDDYEPTYDPPTYGGHPTTEDFGSGSGSVGLCADGTLSDSVGIQGACSHHGGVR